MLPPVLPNSRRWRVSKSLLLLPFLLGAAQAQSVMTTTIAGRAGSVGSFDGPADAARFFSPLGVAIDRAGNIFVADTQLAAIRRLAPDGTVSTFAGGPVGFADGVGRAARFNSPEALAIDAQDNLYVSDVGNALIRKITPAGVVSTLAGAVGQLGSNDGVGPGARFRHPMGLAVDATGTVFVADTANRTIRRITAGGVVTTLAGSAAASSSLVLPVDGVGPAAKFGSPHGIVVDATGTLFVSDAGYRTIRRISPQGVVTTIAGTHTGGGVRDGTGLAALFSFPSALALHPSGDLYLLEPDMQVIRRITPAGVVTTVAGVPGLSGAADGSDRDVRFNWPGGIAINRAGDLIIADTRNYTLRRRGPVFAPTITTQPADITLAAGATLRLSLAATGTPAAAYQWYKDSALIPGATEAAWVRPVARIEDAGSYFALVSNLAGSVSTRNAQVVVEPPPAALAPLAAATVTDGAELVLNPSFRSGLPASFQWHKDGVPLAGATAATLTLARANASHGGNYSVVITNAAGSLTLGPAAVTVLWSRFANLSVRTAAGAGPATLIVGFVVSGTSRTLLVRGAGPSLAQYGISGTLADPRLTLYQGPAALAANDDWTASPDAALLSATAVRVGAFPLPNPGWDAALLQTLGGGAYTAHVSGPEGSAGICLAELYDASLPGDTRLVNLSARAEAGTGEASLIAGFVIDGNARKRVLVRGAGPALAAFGVAGALADPRIIVFRNGLTAIAANDDWGADPEVAAAAVRVNAFAFPAGSRDAALVVQLDPGAYTVQVSGADARSGGALIEVYEVP